MLITTRPEDVAVAAPDDVASAAAGVSRRARPRRTVSINRRFGLDSSKTYRKLRLGNMNMPAAAERVARSVALEQAYVYDVYEQFSDNPRSKPWPRVNQFLDNLEPGSIVCDVGCGNGKYLNANSSIYNIGGEKCVRLSKIAREKDNEVLVLDNLSLPFRDESLDAVLSIAVVHHFATTERRVCALRELARVLRIGGRLIITVWAMEQRYRKFESQDVLVPWRRPQTLSTPSLELTSTTNTSDDDGFSPYHAYTQTSDSDSIKSNKCKSGTRKRGKTKHKGRSIDPGRSSSPSSSSLSSPNETCYSFVRRAIQKLAGGKRVHHHHNHRPWFLEGWTTCGKEPKRYKHDCEYVNVQDIPIELRRVDDDDDDHNELLLVQPQRRQTFPSSQILNDLYASLKSKSMTNIRTTEPNAMTRSQSSVPSVPETDETATGTQPDQKAANEIDDESDDRPKATNKPRLVKQKQSICEEDADEALDKATDMKSVETNERLFGGRHGRGNVYKQRSLNEEELTDRRKEKERVRQNIQKQASLNEDLIYHHRHHHHHHHGIGGASIKETIFSATTAKRLQLFKSDFATKLKNSTTNIEKVAGASLKNGFVRIFQNWKSPETTVTTTAQPLTGNKEEEAAKKGAVETTVTKENSIERRPSKEDGSDSSKDSSLQSDTSVDSEDSFASVIFVPKSNPMSPNLSPGPTSPRVTAGNCSAPNSPRIKQSSCPTSPRIKQIPLSVYPLTKQLSSPKPTTNTSLEPTFAADTKPVNSPNVNSNPNSDSTSSVKTEVKSSPLEKKTASKTNLALKYSVQEIPKFKNNERRNAADEDTDKLASLNKIKELLTQKTAGFGTRSRSHYYPIVRHSSIGNNGAVQTIAKPLPKLLSLELFNPETDDKDSDSSVVSSPDSVGSALVAHGNKKRINSAGPAQTRFLFPSTKTVKNPKKEREKAKAIGKSLAKEFLDAAADVANSLDDAVNKAIASSPRRRDPKPGDVLSVIHRQYTDATPLLSHEAIESSWDDECQRHLTDFADRLSEKLLHEIDQYQEQKRSEAAAASGLSAAAAAASGLSVSAAAAASTNLASSSTSSSSVDIDDDPYIHRLSEELNDLSRLSAEIQKQNEYLARLSAKDRVFVRCVRCKAVKCTCTRSSTTDKSGNNCGGARVINRAATNEKGNESDEGRNAFKNQPSLESCDSSYSLLSGSSLLGNSTESNDSQRETDGKSSERTDSPKDATTTTTSTRFSGEGGGGGSSGSTTVSLQSLTSCPDWKPFKSKSSTNRSDAGDVKGPNRVADHAAAGKEGASFVQTYSDTSQESLPSSDGNNVGGEIIYHRFYHVFREGELDQLIEKYVENLHIISSYYDRSSWCVVAEKVQVWTI